MSLPELPPIGEELRELLHYNPNTDDVIEAVNFYALAYGKACRDAALEEAAQKCSDTRDDAGLAEAKPYENTHDDGWLDGCNECEWAIRSLKVKP